MERVCCQCGKVKRNGRWVQAPQRSDGSVSHGFCDACAARFMEQLEQFEQALDAPVQMAVSLCG